MLDIWIHIIKSIESDKIKCRTAMTCKGLSNREFYFHEKIHISKIVKSRWFDYFTNVVVSEKSMLPLHIKRLSLGCFFKQPIDNYIPSSITHLDIGTRYLYFYDDIPASVIHLSFNKFCGSHNRSLTLSSVTHLTINKLCCGLLQENFPISVTHLTFGGRCSLLESDCVPSTVTNLIFTNVYLKDDIYYIKKKYRENNVKISFPAYEKKQNKRLRMIGI